MAICSSFPHLKYPCIFFSFLGCLQSFAMCLSQMATYWFVIAWFNNQSVQKSKVRQAAKDVVKSEVYLQTYSP